MFHWQKIKKILSLCLTPQIGCCILLYKSPFLAAVKLQNSCHNNFARSISTTSFSIMTKFTLSMPFNKQTVSFLCYSECHYDKCRCTIAQWWQAWNAWRCQLLLNDIFSSFKWPDHMMAIWVWNLMIKAFLYIKKQCRHHFQIKLENKSLSISIIDFW